MTAPYTLPEPSGPIRPRPSPLAAGTLILGAVVAGAIFFFVLVPLAIIFLALAALGVLVIYIRLRLRRLFAGPRAREGRINVRVREPNDA